jgi:hypothetical protein
LKELTELIQPRSGQWVSIFGDARYATKLGARSPGQLKDKWRTLCARNRKLNSDN